MKIFIHRTEIEKKVREMAAIISQDYKGKEIVLLGVLKGAAVFISDLCREITIPVQIEFIQVKSYEGKLSSGTIKILKEPSPELITGKHVIVIEDIIDTGLTLDFIMKYLKTMNPASLSIATFLYKKEKFSFEYTIHYYGFIIEDMFVVGYGMDYNEDFRNLSDIQVIDS